MQLTTLSHSSYRDDLFSYHDCKPFKYEPQCRLPYVLLKQKMHWIFSIGKMMSFSSFHVISGHQEVISGSMHKDQLPVKMIRPLNRNVFCPSPH